MRVRLGEEGERAKKRRGGKEILLERERMVQSQMKEGRLGGMSKRGSRRRRGEREKFDYSRWGDYYCAAGRAEEGTGGQRGGEKARAARHLSEKKTASSLSPVGDFPREETGAVARRGFACG